MPEQKWITVAYHDEPEDELMVFVSIDKEWTEKEDDDNIFFYFDTQEEYENAKQIDNGLEFRIIKEDSE
jgi:hypothetical protein